ncbi:HMG-box [Basidiobolus meristosporus CBS 931.73]|uniref:HMG-box n=1 Tax=Basidiobolus meristosporus CBS 931.73 TaxID=1314790 RepID=A0A1Y1XZ76_9FUNG|nr:HMG-box [Basidiobolus meristosporus CBS 931.73]|eukprot:ORX91073.1 HMG-box [Basidiobolus meristosporus CBS 931.73]
MEVSEFLRKCKLEQYIETFISEGFDQLKSLLEITESDLAAMDVKRGHRRLLQREIASVRGVPSSHPIGIPLVPPENAFLAMGDAAMSSLPIHQLSPTSGDLSPDANGSKRKYRRHPKPDKNAPEKPPSAYVMFSNKVRNELKDQNMSFTEIAKIVGDRWKSISPEEKDEVERSAAKAKEEYYESLRAYKETEEYKEYQSYLEEFRKKSGSCVRPVGRPRKHPKTEDGPDASSVIQHPTSIPNVVSVPHIPNITGVPGIGHDQTLQNAVPPPGVQALRDVHNVQDLPHVQNGDKHPASNHNHTTATMSKT